MKKKLTIASIGVVIVSLWGVTPGMAQVRDYEPGMVIEGSGWKLTLTRLEVIEDHTVGPLTYRSNPGEKLLLALGPLEGLEEKDVGVVDRDGNDLSRPQLRMGTPGLAALGGQISPVQSSPQIDRPRMFIEVGGKSIPVPLPAHIVMAFLPNGRGVCMTLPDQAPICVPEAG